MLWFFSKFVNNIVGVFWFNINILFSLVQYSGFGMCDNDFVYGFGGMIKINLNQR